MWSHRTIKIGAHWWCDEVVNKNLGKFFSTIQKSANSKSQTANKDIMFTAMHCIPQTCSVGHKWEEHVATTLTVLFQFQTYPAPIELHCALQCIKRKESTTAV